MTIDVGPIIRQGDPPHGARTLGTGPRTIGQAGCLLTCFVMAHRSMHGASIGVLEAHARISIAGGFVGSGLITGKAAAALGMVILDRAAFNADEASRHLAARRPVVIGIDYKAGASSGFSDADHFVLAIGSSATAIKVADPATARLLDMEFARTFYAGRPARLAEMIVLGKA